MAIRIKESGAPGYRERTIENASAEAVTIAFATDFTTRGEILTKNAVNRAGKHYVQVPLDVRYLSEWRRSHEAASIIINSIKPFCDKTGHVGVNIAGNSLTSFPSEIAQKDIDLFMARTLLIVQHSTGGMISSVRSGGQTGIDEAGVKAADVLGIPALVHCPKDYAFRIRQGNGHMDVRNKAHFVQRFADDSRHRQHLEPIARINSQLMVCPEETRADILKGRTYEIVPGSFVELAPNTEGVDRLWVNDYLFDEFFEKLNAERGQSEPKETHNVYYLWEVIYEGQASSESRRMELVAPNLEEAESICRNTLVHRSTEGVFPAEVYSIAATAIFIDGNGYSVDPASLMESEMEDIVSQFKHRRPDMINIWYASGENADLSNFAVRPFPFRTGEDDYENFQSVEQAFQYMKTLPQYSSMDDQKRESLQKRILSTVDGAELKSLGRSVPGLDSKAWNKVAGILMKDMIRMSFDYNPAAKQRLVDTGDAQFLHHQERGPWKYNFPYFLNEVRTEFRRKQQRQENYKALKEGGQVPVDMGLHFYEGDIKPEQNVIFVFGSNVEGRHGLGAAKEAVQKFGAVYGRPEGLQGSSYAIPTKDLRVKANKGYRSVPEEKIVSSIAAMYRCAEQNPDKVFKVAYRNPPHKYTLNGYSGAEMVRMFLKAGTPPMNVQFSMEWKQEMLRQVSRGCSKHVM